MLLNFYRIAHYKISLYVISSIEIIAFEDGRRWKLIRNMRKTHRKG